MDKTKVAEGTEKFKAAVKSAVPVDTNTEGEESKIDKKKLALAIGKVTLGVGAVIAAYKIGTKLATKDEDQQDETA